MSRWSRLSPRTAWSGSACCRGGTPLESGGVPAEPDAIQAFFDAFYEELRRELGVNAGSSEVEAEVAWLLEDAVLFPETTAVLEEVHGTYRMAIVSNGLYQAETSRRLGIAHFFDTIIGSLHVGLRKPMPEMFELVLSCVSI